MSITAVLLPVFVQVGLTFFLLGWTGRSRFMSIRNGDVKLKDVALGERNWPVRTQQISNAFENQFQVPVLFYVLVALALITRKADLVFVLMSWLFVATRIAHAAIYATSNKVPRRFQAFLAGVSVLALMWIVFALRVVFSDAGV